MPELRAWEVVHGCCIEGDVYGHSRFQDGSRIRTSRIIHLQGRWAQTISGTTYRLRDRAPGSAGDEHSITMEPATARARAARRWGRG